VSDGWERHAYRAATDRLAIPGRTLDAGFVAGLEVDAIAAARDTGEDVLAALDGLHEGLAAAVAAPVPGVRRPRTPQPRLRRSVEFGRPGVPAVGGVVTTCPDCGGPHPAPCPYAPEAVAWTRLGIRIEPRQLRQIDDQRKDRT
jgi:hypothetical protein